MKAVIFDFDYTLADSSRGAVECLRHALESAGLEVPREEAILATIGLSMTETLNRLAPGHPTGELSRLFIQRADQVMADMTVLFEDTEDVLRELRRRGWRIGIVSNKFRYRILDILTREGLADLVDAVVGGEDVERHKPDPEGLKKAMVQLDAMPGETVFVGDSVTDGRTARATGVPFIAVRTGVTPGDSLFEYEPIAVANCLREILPHLDPSAKRGSGTACR